MRLLLDTHLLLWMIEDSPKLSAQARGLISDDSNQVIFSASNIWEIAVKHAKGLPWFVANPVDVRKQLLSWNYEELPILSGHAIQAATLPPIHKDPFDRILVAQAQIEGILLLTRDETLASYPGPIRKV